MKKYFDELLNMFKNSFDSIDEKKFNELLNDCTDTLKAGKKIILSGLGKNVPVCDKFVGTMTSLGLDARFMNTNSAVHGDLGMVQKGDLVIILTKSGATSESVYLYNLLQQRECTLWCLTFEKEGYLAQKMDKALIVELEHEGDKWNLVPNNSTTLNLIVLQMLAMRIADVMDVSLQEFKINHPGGHIGEVLKNEP